MLLLGLLSGRTGQRWSVRSAEGQPGHVGEDAIGGDERRVDVDGRRRDPEILVMCTIGQGMPVAAAFEAEVRHRVEQGVGDGHDGGGRDGGLEAGAACVTPLCDEGPVAKLGNGLHGEEQLVARQSSDKCVEAGSPASTERCAEDSGVDDEPHEESAAAKASSSSSVSSSMSNASSDTNTGAAASSSSVRSRGRRSAPWGPWRSRGTALLTAQGYRPLWCRERARAARPGSWNQPQDAVSAWEVHCPRAQDAACVWSCDRVSW